MSSGFVSGGTIDKPTERDDEWRAAQAELEAKRLEREDRDRQHDGKSLYEVLQANKGESCDIAQHTHTALMSFFFFLFLFLRIEFLNGKTNKKERRITCIHTHTQLPRYIRKKF